MNKITYEEIRRITRKCKKKREYSSLQEKPSLNDI